MCKELPGMGMDGTRSWSVDEEEGLEESHEPAGLLVGMLPLGNVTSRHLFM